jgi:leucyl/phenylalanyl-tRNA--protein transferase
MPTYVFLDDSIETFPDPRTIGMGDVVAFGGELRPERLRLAYRSGIFPWPHPGVLLPWYCPRRRAVLEFDRLHIPESLQKAQRKHKMMFTIDQAFVQVIRQCALMPRPGQEGTWINTAMQKAYTELHRQGDAHSVEAWDSEGNLVGGLYGVDAGGVFCGESMFFHTPNASKLALLYLIDHVRERGATFLDIQQLTPHMERLGAREILREDFLARLWQIQSKGLVLFDKTVREVA